MYSLLTGREIYVELRPKTGIWAYCTYCTVSDDFFGKMLSGVVVVDRSPRQWQRRSTYIHIDTTCRPR